MTLQALLDGAILAAYAAVLRGIHAVCTSAGAPNWRIEVAHRPPTPQTRERLNNC
jgi:hypothetical protein